MNDLHTTERIWWTRVFFVFVLLTGLYRGCHAQSVAVEAQQKAGVEAALIITDLLVPVKEAETNEAPVVDSKDLVPATMVWDTEADIIPELVLQTTLKKWWNTCIAAPLAEKGTACSLTQQEFQEAAVIPYIHGLWLDSHALFRTPDMIDQAAEDKLIVHEGSTWPVFYPNSFGESFAKNIASLSQDPSLLSIHPLPENKPTPASVEGQQLYNDLGLLFLPNAYIVPGGTFNEMYGWDSAFIIDGLLTSAGLVLKGLKAGRAMTIYQTHMKDGQEVGVIYNSLDDPEFFENYAQQLFQVAKGMVDNHIFQINFYGGYILNANRSYYLTRSQPPLFTHEILAVYEFQKAFATTFDYMETLHTADNPPYDKDFLATLIADLPPIDSFDAWMTYEALPAAVAYYNYWTAPDTFYQNWSPWRENVLKGGNPRVIQLASGAGPTAYRFYTQGLGPAPEVARSTQSGNTSLYTDAAEFLAAHPEENPGNAYYPNSAEGWFGLTQAFYASDRAIRASGYDLSGRYGAQGQYATDFAPVSLNTLLYQMGKDIQAMIAMFGTAGLSAYGMSQEAIIDFQGALQSRIVTGQIVINEWLWDHDHGYYSDLRWHAERANSTEPKRTYPYGTMFYPLFADGLMTSANAERGDALIAMANSVQPITQDQVFFFESDGFSWIQTQGDVFYFTNESTGELESVKADSQSSFLTMQAAVRPPTYTGEFAVYNNYGIPTSLVETGNQWDFPFAWAPVQLFAFTGLANFAAQLSANENKMAAITARDEILQGWINAVDIFFADKGIIIEKYISYDPEADPRASRGYSKAQVGFGWSNSTYLNAIVQQAETGQ